MARIRNILNPWGKQSRTNLQRSDLWQVDLSAVTQGIRDALGYCPNVPPYFSVSVNLPELKVAHAPIRRDSRSYLMPALDDALEPVRFVFRMDDGQAGSTSDNAIGTSTIYQVLDLWRRLVRAGRGAVGNEPQLTLNSDYRIDYAFPVYLYLLRGYGQPLSAQTVSRRSPPPELVPDTELASQAFLLAYKAQLEVLASQQQLFKQQMEDGLYISGLFALENAWLSGFKLSDLNYDTSGHLTVEATVCCENILPASDPLYE